MKGMDFSTVVAAQCKQMTHMASVLDERGYIMFLHGMNLDGLAPKYLQNYLDAGLLRYYVMWRKENRRRTVHIQVWPENKTRALAIAQGKPFDHPIRFVAHIPRTRSHRPIVVSLELMSSRTKGRHNEIKGAGHMLCTELSDRFEFAGGDKTSLMCVLKVLDMPQHREVLTRRV